jgi:hypothetical protein
MLPILGMVLQFFAKIQIFVGFKFKVSSFGLINQNFALYLRINCSKELLLKFELDIELEE